MDCDETQDLLHGYLDDELDVVSSRALTQHLQACPACTQAYEAQHVLRTALRTSALSFTPPPSLHKQIHVAVRRASRADTRPMRWTWGGLSVAVAMALVVPDGLVTLKVYCLAIVGCPDHATRCPPSSPAHPAALYCILNPSYGREEVCAR